MASLASVVRISAPKNTRFTDCDGCGSTVALTPDQTRCQACQAAPQRVTRRRLPRAA